MAGKSDILENKLLDFLFRGYAIVLGSSTATWSPNPPALHIALGTAATDGSFTELAATGSYARAKAHAGTYQANTDWNGTHGTTTGASSGTDGITENAVVFTFPTATADWNTAATIGFFAIYDAATTGNLLYSAALTTARAVTNGTTASFAAGALTVQEDQA
jgi:hypothetical protein